MYRSSINVVLRIPTFILSVTVSSSLMSSSSVFRLLYPAPCILSRGVCMPEPGKRRRRTAHHPPEAHSYPCPRPRLRPGPCPYPRASPRSSWGKKVDSGKMTSTPEGRQPASAQRQNSVPDNPWTRIRRYKVYGLSQKPRPQPQQSTFPIYVYVGAEAGTRGAPANANLGVCIYGRACTATPHMRQGRRRGRGRSLCSRSALARAEQGLLRASHDRRG
ncbi:hypothetical protein V8D89_008565 [Ganoderma adspersum]